MADERQSLTEADRVAGGESTVSNVVPEPVLTVPCESEKVFDAVFGMGMERLCRYRWRGQSGPRDKRHVCLSLLNLERAIRDVQKALAQLNLRATVLLFDEPFDRG